MILNTYTIIPKLRNTVSITKAITYKFQSDKHPVTQVADSFTHSHIRLSVANTPRNMVVYNISVSDKNVPSSYPTTQRQSHSGVPLFWHAIQILCNFFILLLSSLSKLYSIIYSEISSVICPSVYKTVWFIAIFCAKYVI